MDFARASLEKKHPLAVLEERGKQMWGKQTRLRLKRESSRPRAAAFHGLLGAAVLHAEPFQPERGGSKPAWVTAALSAPVQLVFSASVSCPPSPASLWHPCVMTARQAPAEPVSVSALGAAA